MTALAMGAGYPAFDTEAIARRKRIPDFTAIVRFPSDSYFFDDLASLHAIALRPDVGIIVAVQQLPKISVSGESAVVDIEKILSAKTLIPNFTGSKESLREFSYIYNGRGLHRLARTVAGASLSKARLMDLVASIVEDALIATSSHLMTDGSNIVTLNEDEEFVLKSAIAERLPRVYDENAMGFAEKLLCDLKMRIGARGALAIDDGAVFMASNKLHILDVGNVPVSFKAAD